MLLDLAPGRQYNVTVVTEAGDLQSSRSIEARTGREGERGMLGSFMSKSLSFVLAPSAVSNITVADSNSTSLRLSWQQPRGDLDALVVALSTNGSSLRETALPADAAGITVDQLIPGSAYQLAVTTRSGELSSQSAATVRTRECRSLNADSVSTSSSSSSSSSRLQLQLRCPSSLCLPPSTAASS